MKGLICNLCLLTLLSLMALGQTKAVNYQSISSFPYPSKVVLKEGTMVCLRNTEVINSKTTQVGDVIVLQVYLDLEVNGNKVVNAGTSAIGRISAIQRPGIFGRPARIELDALNIIAIDGQSIPVQYGSLVKVGKSRGRLAWGISFILPAVGIIIGSPHFMVFAAVGLFVKGKTVEIPFDSKFTAVVQKDIEIQISGEG